MTSAGTFRDVQGRLVRVPTPSLADLEAIAAYRSELNRRLAPEVVLDRIRKHTAVLAMARRTPNG